MKTLHFLFTNGDKFSLELPEGSTVRERVSELSAFVADNNAHVEEHKELYSSSSPVKFRTSRGFFLGYDSGDGAIKTILTPNSTALKYRGKALLLATLAGDIQKRIDTISNRPPVIGCMTGFTGDMQKVIDKERANAEAAKQKRLAAGTEA